MNFGRFNECFFLYLCCSIYSLTNRHHVKEFLRNLVTQGKIEQTIEQLLVITKKIGDQDLNNQTISISAQFKGLMDKVYKGEISESDKTLQSNQLNSSLLYLIDKLPEGIEPPKLMEKPLDSPSKEPEAVEKPPKVAEATKEPSKVVGKANTVQKTPEKKGKVWSMEKIGLFIAVLGLIVAIGGYTLKDFLSPDKIESFPLTVLVHGKEGRDDRILKGQGKVVLDIGTARKEADINGMGEATFKELPIGYDKEKAFLSIEHPQPYFPVNRDTKYTLNKGASVYLEIELKGIDKIEGRVLDFETEKPLDKVRVSIKNIETFTDTHGWYELQIPSDKQAKFVRANFYKEGYQMEDIDSIAPHTQQEVGISLKKQ